VTLDDLECQNRGYYEFFGDFRLQDAFQEQIALKSIEIDSDKLHMKFSALNVDFDGPRHNFLGLRKPAQESIKERYSRESRYFIVLGPSFAKMVADHHGLAAYHNKC